MRISTACPNDHRSVATHEFCLAGVLLRRPLRIGRLRHYADIEFDAVGLGVNGGVAGRPQAIRCIIPPNLGEKRSILC